jgi:hypothetical protein
LRLIFLKFKLLKNFIKNKEIDPEESLDKMIYGFEVNRLCSKGKQKNYIFFVSHSDNKMIEFIQKGGKTLDKIDISKINEIDFGKKRGNFAKLDNKSSEKLKEELCLSILVNSESLDLVFTQIDDLNQFCFAICSLWQSELEEDANL